jgi:peroxiredoxin
MCPNWLHKPVSVFSDILHWIIDKYNDWVEVITMSMNTRVKPGEMLRDFTLTDLNGETVSLKSFRGRSSVLLSFFRDASCPFCNLRLYELTRKQEDYRRQGMEIVAVFNSSPEVIQKYLGKRARPFPLLADSNKEIFKLYGVESSWGILMKGMFNFSRMFSAFSKGFMPATGAFKPLLPADFLIDQSGKIRATYYSRDAARHISFKLVDKFIVATNKHKKAQNQSVTPVNPGLRVAEA